MDLPEQLDAFQLRWLRACACYPVLRWPLTVYLGRRLAQSDGRSEPPDMDDHAALVRLPWFRLGWLPDRLREQLIAGMSREDRATVRRALEDVLGPKRGATRRVPSGRDDDPVFVRFMLDERPRPAERVIQSALERALGSVGASTARLVKIGLTAVLSGALLAAGTAWSVWDWTVAAPEALKVSLPEMAVLPAGTFIMGSSKEEVGRWDAESPQREVQVAGFEVARSEVTVGEFRKFVQATGYRMSDGCFTSDDQEWSELPGANWSAPGFGDQTDRHPVTCVSWDDAQAYLEWLTEISESKTPFRLPSEAEWEYAARAGTRTAYYWGNSSDQACYFANGADQSAAREFPESGTRSCDDGEIFTAPVSIATDPVRRYNGFGLFDTSGNVFEWTQDCWHDTYEGAPSDAAPWEDDLSDFQSSGKNYASGQGGFLQSIGSDCPSRVMRGGSWSVEPRNLRSAVRGGFGPLDRNDELGFRPARTLTP